jgi:NAD-dependent dihydropyrimidine dehydrogenase PreA subunit
MAAELFHTQAHCTLCGECARVCPNDAIQLNAEKRRYDSRKCSVCGQCVLACPTDALELCGTMVDEKTLWDKIKDDRAFWDRSGGGITLSGGEPLLQYEFIGRFLSRCKSHYVHTAIETCGYVPESHLNAVLPHVDLFIFDFKAETAHSFSTWNLENQINFIVFGEDDIICNFGKFCDKKEKQRRRGYLRKVVPFNCSPQCAGNGYPSEFKAQFTSFLSLCIEGLNCGYKSL